jgi:hypothetical protein
MLPKDGKVDGNDSIARLQGFWPPDTVADMDKEVTIRRLYPHLKEQQAREAEDNLEQYLLLVLRIYDRLISDPETYTQFRALTARTGTLGCTPPRSKALADVNTNRPT